MTSSQQYDQKYKQTLSFLTAMWFNSLHDRYWNLGCTIDLFMLIQFHKSVEMLEQLCDLYEQVGPEMEPENDIVH